MTDVRNDKSDKMNEIIDMKCKFLSECTLPDDKEIIPIKVCSESKLEKKYKLRWYVRILEICQFIVTQPICVYLSLKLDNVWRYNLHDKTMRQINYVISR